MPRHRLWATVILGLVLAFGDRTATRAAQDGIPDAEFRRLVTELSEPGGAFARQLMSNEDSAQFVLPALRAAVAPDGVYLGVGSEQNFTYIAALRPKLAFVIDIRRDNMLEMLLYKALFELSPDRADFISRLFSRPRPDHVSSASTADDLFAELATTQPDARLTDETLRDVLQTLTVGHGMAVREEDRSAIAETIQQFRLAGPNGLKGYGDRTNPTYARLMAAGDLTGRQDSFLASEANYRLVRGLEQRNAIVPIVADFAGETGLAGIARELRARHLVVNAFYVSNVERYLFEQGPHGRQFYTNLAALPLDSSSLMIRSVTRAISTRLDIPLPAGQSAWWTFLTPIRECLDGITSGRIQSYRDLFVRDK